MVKDYGFLRCAPRGVFYAKKAYADTPLPVFTEEKDRLPSPILDAKPLWVRCYWHAVETLFRNIHKPTPGSGFVSNFVDAAFNRDIFLWDTCFMSFFCNLLHPHVPGIRSLDNFYCKQFDDGEIPRELVRDTGEDLLLWVNAYDKPLYSYFHRHYGFRALSKHQNIPYEEMYKPDLGRTPARNPYLTLDNLNHPIAALAEWESYLHTGDIARLCAVFEPLYRCYEAMREQIRHKSGLYVTDWASMDNSPRNRYLGCGVDISCEMVLFARNLTDMLRELDRRGMPVADAAARERFLCDSLNETQAAVQAHMWDEKTGFFYDVDAGGRRAGVKTAAAFWALISGVADARQQACLAAWLEDENTFKRPHRVPVLAADEKEYDPNGGYWSGSVWAPINQMIVLGLEKCGRHALARDIAMNHLSSLCKVYEDTGAIWENYPADYLTAGDSDHRDLVGWSGIAPILYLIQYAVGLSVRAEGGLCWRLDDALLDGGVVGCDRYWFQGTLASLRARRAADGLRIDVQTEGRFPLRVLWRGRDDVRMVEGDTGYLIG